MARLLVQHDTDPGIVVILEDTNGPDPWYGECTECGRAISEPDRDTAILTAQVHVDEHEDAR